MPTLISADNSAMTPSQREAHEASVIADAQKYGVDLKQFGAAQKPTAPPALTPADKIGLEQGLTKAPTIASMASQASKMVADQLVASMLHTTEAKHGSPLSFAEKQALEAQIRAKVSRALAVDGHAAPAEPLSEELAQIHRATGVPANTDPSFYDLDINRPELAADRQLNARAVASKWASDLSLDPHIAASLISHISETTANLQKYTPDQIAKWSARQTETLLKSQNGDQKKVDALIARAHAVLAMSDTIEGQFGPETFSAALKDSLVGKSAFFIKTLAAQADALETLIKAKAKMGDE